MTCNVDGPRWQLDNQGNKLHWVIDNMMEEGLRSNHWFVHNVETYHRSISTLMNGFIDAGFLIDRVLEPEASADELDKRPSLAEQSRRPCFLTIRARKPE